MKILFVQTNYPGFLDSFYSKDDNWERLSYKEIKKRWAKEWFGSANFYSMHLVKLGWRCEEVIANDFKSQKKWAEENKLKVVFNENKYASRLPAILKHFFRVNGWTKEILFAQVEKFKPDVIYFHDLWLMNKGDILSLKKKTKLIVGQIASPIPPFHDTLRTYDLIITSLPNFIEKFKSIGVKTEYLKWCFEKSIAKKINKKKRIYDTVFVGSFTHLHTKGGDMFQYLSKKIKLDLWGYGNPDYPNYHGHAAGREMYEIFAKSKIVINRHIDLSEDYANNMRLYEATGMGALLITDNKKNMEEFFRVGKEVIVYTSYNDLVRKVKYYLAHPSERMKIARAGQKRTIRDHSYEVRMKELDKILRKYLKINEM